MEGKRFLNSIRLQNILSFGPDTPELPLEPLNVLIGPNASGKSNLIEALSLLAAAPHDLQQPIREGGGVHEWLWKGAERLGSATMDVTLEYPKPLQHAWQVSDTFAVDLDVKLFGYRLSFKETTQRFDLQDESVEDKNPSAISSNSGFYYRYQGGAPIIAALTSDLKSRSERPIKREELKPDQSILSQRRDPDFYPEVTWVAGQFSHMRFYREWNFGRLTPTRRPQSTDLPKDFLLEDASNLGVLLSDLLNRPDIRCRIFSLFRTFYQEFKDIRFEVAGSQVRMFFHEHSLGHAVPAERLSDGTLRYLCLLAILCHPDPPPVICLEEPELGLHPDIIPEVAKLLVEASTRTQLFVTTHSDILVDSLSDTPEAVIVCEKTDGATQLQRLDAEEFKPWLEKYRLGELWTSGHIGGNRW